MTKQKKSIIAVQGAAITVLSREQGDYISLTDMVRNFEGGSALIENWLRNKDTVLFLAVWEQLHNPTFNSLEFEGIKNEAGRNSFFLSARKWIELTGAQGLVASTGRYGGTYAQPRCPANRTDARRPAGFLREPTDARSLPPPLPPLLRHRPRCHGKLHQRLPRTMGLQRGGAMSRMPSVAARVVPYLRKIGASWK
ncbi:KilA-N domain protein [mine drainage metagenome]|uniref:KilA-N domain protein n=1 Tax=mine drainage metagenome TaxID=410659 RepID=A0A1J5RPU8_9ZZZZ